MTEPMQPERGDNAEWRSILLGEHPELQRMRRFFRHLPSDPRCKLCLAPQAGFGPIVSLFGFGRYPANPQLCNACFRSAQKHPGGATLDIAALFADIRGSTGLAESMSPSAYSVAVSDYLRSASRAIREGGGLVDKLLGDGVMGLFLPGFAGERYVSRAVEAGRAILGEARLPVGVGIHTGPAWVGFVGGLDDVMDFTALGDAVNVASRLGSEAGGGEILLSAATVEAAKIPTEGLTAQRLELRGREEALEAWIERTPGAGATARP
ncbi:MAG TPA: adenylate/guanylate cyclase domain-containing protein [Candidatus Limnocylindria bacterium]|nr:adenylate/guanylate cyclase domain-containing protein [Candidatus Limnocylindria bacterium]